MDIEQKLLIELGLNPTEAKVYLACLELGSDSVLNIAKKANVKRPTCYLTLNTLFQKTYVSKIEKKSTTLYSAEKPSIILNKHKEKIANFQDLLPFYEAKFNRGQKPKIRYYEGKEAIWNIYTQVIFPNEETHFFGTDSEKLCNTFPGIIEYWRGKYPQQYKKSKEISSNNKEGARYFENERKYRSIRLMPKDLPVFADSVITEDKIFIVSFEHKFGVLIESEDLAKTYKNFFLLAWKAAEK